jgi:hypothetical protein
MIRVSEGYSSIEKYLPLGTLVSRKLRVMDVSSVIPDSFVARDVGQKKGVP